MKISPRAELERALADAAVARAMQAYYSRRTELLTSSLTQAEFENEHLARENAEVAHRLERVKLIVRQLKAAASRTDAEMSTIMTYVLDLTVAIKEDI